MNNFTQRTIFGAIYVAVVVGLLWVGPIGLIALLFLVGIVGIAEFLKLKQAFEWPVYLSLCFLHVLIILSSVNLIELDIFNNHWTLSIIACWSLAHILFLIRRHGTTVFDKLSPHVFAIIYLSLPLALFGSYSTSTINYNFVLPLLGFILVWSSDTFAYLSGKWLGKTALSPTLSPGKTVEGFVGGTILTAAMGGYLCWLWGLREYWAEGIILGAIVSVVGTAGDLFQSALKRQAGVKDSGNIIPGHGGILDRFDAFLFVAVVLWIWAQFTLN